MSALLPNAFHIARREYLHRVRSRAFVVSTVILAVVAFVAGLSPLGTRALDRAATAHLAIVNEAPDLAIDPVGAANVVLNAGALAQGDQGHRSYDIVALASRADAVAGARSGRYLGALVIDRAPNGKLSYELVSNVSPAGTAATILKLAAVWISIEDGLQRSGLSPATGGGPYEAFTVTPVNPGRTQPSETQAVGLFVIAQLLVILVFATVMTYGMWVAVSVVEEKSSRVMELMLGAASSAQLLAGKVVGVGLAGLTQYAAILAAGTAAIIVEGPIERLVFGAVGPGDSPLSGLTPEILVAFVAFFVLGFLLYALLYAAAASLVARQEDVQQVAMPMIALALVGYLAASLSVRSIEDSWVAPLSLVPFFAPYFMVARIALGAAQPWEVGLSLLLLVVTIALATLFAARVYRVGILLYGQRPGLRAYLAALTRR